MEGLDRAARHLIDTFGANAARVAEDRALRAAEDGADLGGSWGAIARRVREIDQSGRTPRR
jgi:hypothetical protein